MTTQARRENEARVRGQEIQEKERMKASIQASQMKAESERPHDYFPSTQSNFSNAEFTAEPDNVPKGAMDGVREAFDFQQDEKGTESNPQTVAVLRAPTVESALEVIEQLLSLVAHRTNTTVDDFVLRHVTALRNSPELVRELQNDLDLLLGTDSKPRPAMAMRQRLALLTRILELLRRLGGNLDLTMILEIMAIAHAILRGEASFSEILDLIQGLFDRSRALQAGQSPETVSHG